MKGSFPRLIFRILYVMAILGGVGFFVYQQRYNTRRMEVISLKGEGEAATVEFRRKSGSTLARKFSELDAGEQRRVLADAAALQGKERKARFAELKLELHYRAFRVHQTEGMPVAFVFDLKNSDDGMMILVRDLQVQCVESEGEHLPPREWSASFERGLNQASQMALVPKPRPGVAKRRILELKGHVDVDVVATKTFRGSVKLPREAGEKRIEAIGDNQVELEWLEDGSIVVKAVNPKGFTGSAGFYSDGHGWDSSLAAADAGETAEVELTYITCQPFAEGRLAFEKKADVANP